MMAANFIETIAAQLNNHHPTRGMAVASGVTCECGYWTGNEVAGRTRPVGSNGRDQLDWHRANIIAPVVHMLMHEAAAQALDAAQHEEGAPWHTD